MDSFFGDDNMNQYKVDVGVMILWRSWRSDAWINHMFELENMYIGDTSLN